MFDNKLTGDVLILEIMERYGWDWYTYHNQPAWVLDLIRKKIGAEAKIAEHASKK